MKLSEFKTLLNTIHEIGFIQTDGNPVPQHFHITEAGLTTKHFIDCGGTIRTEKSVNFQLWVAQDYEHRLTPDKLKKIIAIAQPLFGDDDLNVEVEYQTETANAAVHTIGRFNLNWNGNAFVLVPTQTNCLAQDHCGIPPEKQKVKLSDLQSQNQKSACCTPGGGCC
jgi:hypothetical protein